MQLFLSVYYKDYRADLDAIRKKGKLIDPDWLVLEQLRVFFQKKIWGKDERWPEWILHVQQRRNAIHSFRSREIGTFKEFYSDIKKYYDLLQKLNSRLPYPDDAWS